MALEEYGRVGIRVLPDTSKFRASLKKKLESIEKKAKFALKIDANTNPARKTLNQFAREIQEHALLLNLALDVDDAKRKLKDFLEEEAKKTVNTDTDTTGARAKLATLLRDRWVTIRARLASGSIAKVGAALAALSGARVGVDLVRNLGDRLANLDRALPKIAAVSLAIAALGGAALSSLGSVVALGGSLAQIAGAGLVLPAMFAGAAISIGTLVVALKDAATELAELAPAMEELRSAISGNFWEQARQPIVDMTTTLLPQLSQGFAVVAQQIGGFTADLAAAFTERLDGGVLLGMFESLAAGFERARAGAAGIAGAITTLGVVGSQYMPALGQWVADIANRFDAWLAQTAADGRLQGWIDAGIVGIQQLGSVVASTGRILAGLFEATQAAEFGGLAGLADVLQRVADVVNASGFQEGLVLLLQGAKQGMDAIGQAAGVFGQTIAGLVPTLAGVLTSAGQTVGVALEGIAQAFARPEFAAGLSSLFDGIRQGVEGILPVMPQLGEAFGQLMTLAGQMAASFGPVIGELLGGLAPILADIAVAALPVVEALSGGLLGVMQALLPALQPIVSGLLPVLANILVQLAGLIAPIVQAVAPLLTTILQPIVQVLTAFMPVVQAIAQIIQPIVQAVVALLSVALAPMLSVLEPIASLLAAVLVPVLTVLEPIIRLFAAALQWVATVLTGDLVGANEQFAASLQGLQPIVQGISDFFTTVFGALGEWWNGLWSGMSDWATSTISGAVDTISAGIGVFAAGWQVVWGGITSFFRGVWETIKSVAVNAAQAVLSGLRGMKSGAQNLIGQLFAFVGAIPSRIAGLLSGLGSLLVNSGRSLIQGLINGIRSMIGAVTGTVQNLMAKIRSFFPFSPAKRGPFSGSGYTTFSGRALVSDFAASMRAQIGQVQAAAADVTGAARLGGDAQFTPAPEDRRRGEGTTVHQEIHMASPEDPRLAMRQFVREAKRGLG